MLLPHEGWAGGTASSLDSVELSLLTCSPHEEIYSLYGHTALRVCDRSRGYDVVYNYGVFNFRAPHFVARFVFGKTDYELGRFPTEPFLLGYRRWGSAVTEQVLNLTAEEKRRLMSLLEDNYRPENRVYRYNIFYDNCSTRPRDMIERATDGRIAYGQSESRQTWRELLREKSGHHEWATTGNDMLLGVRADGRPTPRERQFLPEWLMADVEQATIVDAQGHRRPLVAATRVLVPAGTQVVERDFLLTPWQLSVLLVAACMAACLWQWRRRTTPLALRVADMLLLLTTGAIGVVLTVMVFSDHPFTSANLHLVVFNPLLLALLPAAARGRRTPLWTVVELMALTFFVCRLVQHFPLLTEALALCLLLRAVTNKFLSF